MASLQVLDKSSIDLSKGLTTSDKRDQSKLLKMSGVCSEADEKEESIVRSLNNDMTAIDSRTISSPEQRDKVERREETTTLKTNGLNNLTSSSLSPTMRRYRLGLKNKGAGKHSCRMTLKELDQDSRSSKTSETDSSPTELSDDDLVDSFDLPRTRKLLAQSLDRILTAGPPTTSASNERPPLARVDGNELGIQNKHNDVEFSTEKERKHVIKSGEDKAPSELFSGDLLDLCSSTSTCSLLSMEDPIFLCVYDRQGRPRKDVLSFVENQNIVPETFVPPNEITFAKRDTFMRREVFEI